MNKLVLGFATAALLTGCAAPQVALNSSGGAAMNGRTIVQASRPMPDFVITKAGHVALGAIVGGIATAGLSLSAGNDVVRSNGVPDPAGAISAALVKELAAKHSMQVQTPAMAVNSAEPARITAIAAGKVNYVLDVETRGWQMIYFPTDWTHYRVLYVATARLIDTASGTVVAQGKCNHMPKSNLNAPTYEQMVSTNAEGLKRALQVAADDCIATLKSDMLSL